MKFEIDRNERRVPPSPSFLTTFSYNVEQLQETNFIPVDRKKFGTIKDVMQQKKKFTLLPD